MAWKPVRVRFAQHRVGPAAEFQAGVPRDHRASFDTRSQKPMTSAQIGRANEGKKATEASPTTPATAVTQRSQTASEGLPVAASRSMVIARSVAAAPKIRKTPA